MDKNEAIKIIRSNYPTGRNQLCEALETLIPELKESEDEKIRKSLIKSYINQHPANFPTVDGFTREQILAWLEKQDSITKLNEEEQNRFAKGVLSSCAMSFVNYLDAHRYEGKMCVSNGECEDIENAFHNAMWDRLHRYYCKYIEKQGEKKQGKTPIWNHWKDGIAGNGEGKLIYLIKKGNSYSLSSCLGYECDYILLSDLDKLMLQEKQGEKKPADKAEPKLKIEAGKWYICISQYCNCIKGRCYQSLSYSRIVDDFGTEYDMHSDADKYFRPWTIEDAKDGDVLACPSGWTCIFKSLNGDTFSSYCFIDKTGWFCEKGSECHTLNKEFTKAYNGEIKPATKEQRDLLFSKMKEAGYEWDAEKKELKKIEQNLTEDSCKSSNDVTIKENDRTEYKKGFECGKQLVLKYPEDFGLCRKTAWSEDDEHILEAIIKEIEANKAAGPEYDEKVYDMYLSWLKSLKQRMKGE